MTSACPICGSAATVSAPRPFCSRRCADIDLHRWLTGRYVLPADPDPDDDAQADAAELAPTRPDLDA